MKLLTKEILNKLPPLYATEKKEAKDAMHPFSQQPLPSQLINYNQSNS